MLPSLVFLIIAGVTVNAAKLPFDGKIVNGNDAIIDDYPYQVALIYYNNFRCGGSIIGPKHILTAAHCTDGLSAAPMSVRVGSTLYATGGQVIAVDQIFQHAEYDSATYDKDIAILELKDAIEYNERAQPVTLADAEPVRGSWCDVSGWGNLWEGGSLSSRLQQALVPFIPRNVCTIMYEGYLISERMICAGFADGIRDACQGDSGGPLVSDGIQVGVVSWGVGCARQNRPGVYTNVAAMRLWIKGISGI